jgi:hypothetical protein
MPTWRFNLLTPHTAGLDAYTSPLVSAAGRHAAATHDQLPRWSLAALQDALSGIRISRLRS